MAAGSERVLASPATRRRCRPCTRRPAVPGSCTLPPRTRRPIRCPPEPCRSPRHGTGGVPLRREQSPREKRRVRSVAPRRRWARTRRPSVRSKPRSRRRLRRWRFRPPCTRDPSGGDSRNRTRWIPSCGSRSGPSSVSSEGSVPSGVVVSSGTSSSGSPSGSSGVPVQPAIAPSPPQVTRSAPVRRRPRRLFIFHGSQPLLMIFLSTVSAVIR